jgi:Flp pilus assembly protein TadB
MTAPPIAASRQLPRPRVLTVAHWLWCLACALAVGTALATLTRLDTVRADLVRVARDSDPDATADVVDRVVDLSMLVIVGGGLLLGALGAVFALALRAGRGWSRPSLVLLTVLVVVYAVFVVQATGLLVVACAAVAVAAAVCMYLPGSGRFFL